MAVNAISAAVIGTALTLGLVATGATADQPDAAGQTVQSKTAVRSQVQNQQPEGYGSPLAAAGQEVGPQSRRQLGPGDGTGNRTGGSVNGVEKGHRAGAAKGSQSGGAAVKGSKRSAKGPQGSPSASMDRQRLRDPSSGCIGTPTMTGSRASGGQRRGGGGHR